MPRAHRYFLELSSAFDISDYFHDMTPGYVWHITHRCHKEEFLLKFSRDRKRWSYWLFEARKRFGLRVLNYVITSNHIHLLVLDTGERVIPESMQLIAGRTAQEYNFRKKRRGAFWEDRYHATAVETDEHLFTCLVYIDLNMVRAGVVKHPIDWVHGGYSEIQDPPHRYRIIDIPVLMQLCGVGSITELQQQRRVWLENELQRGDFKRDAIWTRSIAVGSKTFIEQIHCSMDFSARNKEVIQQEGKFIIKDGAEGYNADLHGKNAGLSRKNTVKLDII